MASFCIFKTKPAVFMVHFDRFGDGANAVRGFKEGKQMMIGKRLNGFHFILGLFQGTDSHSSHLRLTLSEEWNDRIRISPLISSIGNTLIKVSSLPAKLNLGQFSGHPECVAF